MSRCDYLSCSGVTWPCDLLGWEQWLTTTPCDTYTTLTRLFTRSAADTQIYHQDIMLHMSLQINFYQFDAHVHRYRSCCTCQGANESEYQLWKRKLMINAKVFLCNPLMCIFCKQTCIYMLFSELWAFRWEGTKLCSSIELSTTPLKELLVTQGVGLKIMILCLPVHSLYLQNVISFYHICFSNIRYRKRRGGWEMKCGCLRADHCVGTVEKNGFVERHREKTFLIRNRILFWWEPRKEKFYLMNSFKT